MKVSINILNYNTYEKSRNCIKSCIDQLGVEYKILLIDNHSTDDSLIRLKEEFGDSISYLVNDSNYGYAKGNNIGISHCFSEGIKYSLILNSDITLVGDELLRNMVDVFNQVKDCAVVAPLIYNVTTRGKVLNQNDSSYLKLLRFFSILPKNYRISDKLSTISEAQGSALFVDNEEFLRVGGFPEHYFMYGEEGCFAKKILWNVKKIIWLNDEKNYVLHHHDKSGSVDSWRLYLMGRNRYLEMIENKQRCPIIWPLIFDAFEIKLTFDALRIRDLKWYVCGIKRAKKLVKLDITAQEYIDDARSVIDDLR